MALPRHGNRWLVIAVAVLVEQVGGFMYIFGLLSEKIKDTFHLSQSSLDIVGSSGTVGAQFGIHMGYFYDFFGPKITCAFGGLLDCLGFLLLYLAINFEWDVSAGPLACMTFMYGQGQMTTDLAVIPTIAANFPKHRGMAVGMAKAFVGLSGSLATAFYNGFVYPDLLRFLLLLIGWVVVACVIGVMFLEKNEGGIAPDMLHGKDMVRRKFNIGYVVILVMCAVLLAGTLWESQSTVSRGARLALCFVIIAINVGLVAFLSTRGEQRSRIEESSASERQNGTQTAQPAEAELKQYTLGQALRMLDFWLLWFGSFLASGAGVLLINNIAQVNLALGENAKSSNVFVSLLSISNCVGRIISGTLSDWLTKSFPGFPRPVFLAGSTGCSGILMLTFAVFPHTTTLYATVPVVAAAYGAINALNPVVAAEVFGVEYLGSIYAGFSLSMAFASYGFATFLFGGVYDAHRNGACVVNDVCHPGTYTGCINHSTNHKLTTCCLGSSCTSLSFSMSAGAAALAVCCYLGVAHHARERYAPNERALAATPAISLLQNADNST